MSIHIDDITRFQAIFYTNNIRILVQLSVLTCKVYCIQCYGVLHFFLA